MALNRIQTPSRFPVKLRGPVRAAQGNVQAQPAPVHSAHTASMIAQASRVPRLAKLNTNLQTKGIAAAAARGKGSKR